MLHNLTALKFSKEFIAVVATTATHMIGLHRRTNLNILNGYKFFDKFLNFMLC